MNIKKNDKVMIIKGKDKGKAGKVLQVLTGRDKASVEGLNLLIKHMRPKRQGQKGQRIEFPAPISAANLMLVCPKCGKPTRVGVKFVAVGTDKKMKKFRTCKKCRQVID
jgi:large subunit ribosomal protein L24